MIEAIFWRWASRHWWGVLIALTPGASVWLFLIFAIRGIEFILVFGIAVLALHKTWVCLRQVGAWPHRRIRYSFDADGFTPVIQEPRTPTSVTVTR